MFEWQCVWTYLEGHNSLNLQKLYLNMIFFSSSIVIELMDDGCADLHTKNMQRKAKVSRADCMISYTAYADIKGIMSFQSQIKKHQIVGS